MKVGGQFFVTWSSGLASATGGRGRAGLAGVVADRLAIANVARLTRRAESGNTS